MKDMLKTYVEANPNTSFFFDIYSPTEEELALLRQHGKVIKEGKWIEYHIKGEELLKIWDNPLFRNAWRRGNSL